MLALVYTLPELPPSLQLPDKRFTILKLAN